MAVKERKIITLTTDFGTDNWFVAAMKGVIKSLNPAVEIIDICHNIRRFNVHEAAFTLLNAYSYFPKRTVHMVVVDPGVGSDRLGIAASNKDYFFVAPNNGILSYVMDREENIETASLDNTRYMLKNVSTTFHGRDVFAPAAAHITLGVGIREFGPAVEKPIMLKKSIPGKIGVHDLIGHIIYIDHFGNCITDVTREDIALLTKNEVPARTSIKIRDIEINRIEKTYSDGKEGKLICLFGSSEYLEFSVYKGNAKQIFNLDEGGEFILKVI